MNRIKELRINRGWRQSDLAAKLNSSQQAVGNYETGVRGLDVETIKRKAAELGISASAYIDQLIQDVK